MVAVVVRPAGREAGGRAGAPVRVLVVLPGDPLPPEAPAKGESPPDGLDYREGRVGPAHVSCAGPQVHHRGGVADYEAEPGVRLAPEEPQSSRAG